MSSTKEDLKKMKDSLEKRELEAAVNGEVPVELYLQLLAVYLYSNELVNAKYLWKRIPASIKQANPELGRLWQIGQAMLNRNPQNVYKALDEGQWSDATKPIIAALNEELREKTMVLISQTYKSIPLKDLSSELNMTADSATKLVNDRGWTLDNSAKMVKPKPVSQGKEGNGDMTSYKTLDLHSLTNLISYLEN